MSERAALTEKKKRSVILLTGMSGAGISTALKVFEDLGYEAVDNLRLSLVRDLVASPSDGRPLAVSLDTRNAHFSIPEVARVYHELRAREDLAAQLLFLECSDETLQRRFTETRRRHPLAVDKPVTDGIRRERSMLWLLRDEADQVIDTSDLSLHDLRRLIGGRFRCDSDLDLSLFVTSFSYRQGIPREADLVFDVRFMVNPYWEPSLRYLNGQNAEVAAYIKKDKDYQVFVANLAALLLPLLPRYQQEGKSYLTIAFGCTGGRHRSVVMAEECATFLAGKGYIVGLEHRDMEHNASKKQ